MNNNPNGVKSAIRNSCQQRKRTLNPKIIKSRSSKIINNRNKINKMTKLKSD